MPSDAQQTKSSSLCLHVFTYSCRGINGGCGQTLIDVPPPPPKRYNTITFTNDCAAKTFVIAMAYNMPDKWVASGWYTVGPTQSKTITFPANTNQQLRIYAQGDRDHPLVWETGQGRSPYCLSTTRFTTSQSRSATEYISYDNFNGGNPKGILHSADSCEGLGPEFSVQDFNVWPPYDGTRAEGRKIGVSPKRCN